MAEKKNILTEEGLAKLEDELQDLKVNRRKEVAAKIKEAREQGDLSENAEYDAAKDEQSLKNAEVVSSKDVDANAINIGSTVRIKDLSSGEEMQYKIVGSTEADILGGKISNESPVGVALIGAKAGQTVDVETPKGTVLQYEILEIQK